MKHPLSLMAQIIIWLTVAVIAGLLFAPRMFEVTSQTTSSLTPIQYGGLALAMILIGAVVWTYTIRKAEPKSIDFAFSLGLGLIIARFADFFVPTMSSTTSIIVRLLLAGVITYLILQMIKKMQESWEWVKKLSPVANFVMLTAIVIAATTIATDLNYLVAILLLAAASIYDAIAVWKTQHMVEFTEFFIKRRAIPGIGIPYSDKEKFALLGGGDVFFIILVAASFYTHDYLLMWITAFSMIGSVITLYLLSEEGKFYPALPFIFAGLMFGIVFRFLLPL